MKIGLAAYSFRNNDLDYNVGQIGKALKAAQGKADLVCFGEAFLQGFDSLSWDYEKDREVAVGLSGSVMDGLCTLTLRYGVDLLTGYIERDGDRLYSSCVVIASGRPVFNYRRISRGWKSFWETDGHYCEGTDTAGFLYRGIPIRIALCGDLWEAPERFGTQSLLIWPVYVNFSLAEWEKELPEYAAQAQIAAGKTLFVNSITADPVCHGGAFVFEKGRIVSSLPFDREDILFVDI